MEKIELVLSALPPGISTRREGGSVIISPNIPDLDGCMVFLPGVQRVRSVGDELAIDFNFLSEEDLQKAHKMINQVLVLAFN